MRCGKHQIERPTVCAISQRTSHVPGAGQERIRFGKAAATADTNNLTVAPGQGTWQPDLEAACQRAKEPGKPVLLFQMTGGLGQRFTCTNACRARTVLFYNDKTAKFFNKKFEPA